MAEIPIKIIGHENQTLTYTNAVVLYDKGGSINSIIIEKSHEIIKHLHFIATKNNLWWDQPLGNISIDNEIVLEWWHKEKKLTIYVCTNSIDYIKVWGADMDNEMEDGSISLNENELTSLWKWLTEKELG